jgi:hypothetical protein
VDKLFIDFLQNHQQPRQRWKLWSIKLIRIAIILLISTLAIHGDEVWGQQCPAGTVLNLILGAYILDDVGEPDELVSSVLSEDPPYTVLASEVIVTGTDIMRTPARVTSLEALDGTNGANTAALSIATGLDIELRFLVYPALPVGPLAASATTCSLLMEDIFLGDCNALNTILLTSVVQSGDDPELSEIVMSLSANALIALFDDANNVADECEVCSLDGLVRNWINGRINYKLQLKIGSRSIAYDSRTKENTFIK